MVGSGFLGTMVFKLSLENEGHPQGIKEKEGPSMQIV